MTEHRGRFVALFVGLLLTGLAFTADSVAAASRRPAVHTSAKKATAHVIHKASDSLAGRGMWIW